MATFLFGGYMSYVGGKRLIKGIYYKVNGVKTKGEIIRYNERWDNDDEQTYYTPVIEYYDHLKNRYTIISSSSSNSKSFFDKRTILYLKNSPKKAIEGGFLILWFYPILISFMGFIVLSSGIIMVKNNNDQIEW